MYSVIIESDAKRELYEITLHLETQRTGLSDIFIAEYLEVIEHLSQFPFSVPETSGFHEVMIGRFSVVLVYRVDRLVVVICKIIHVAQSNITTQEINTVSTS